MNRKELQEALFSISFTLANRAKPKYLYKAEEKNIELLQSLIDRVTKPKKPEVRFSGLEINCPTCGELDIYDFEYETKRKHCPDCCQLLDWKIDCDEIQT